MQAEHAVQRAFMDDKCSRACGQTYVCLSLLLLLPKHSQTCVRSASITITRSGGDPSQLRVVAARAVVDHGVVDTFVAHEGMQGRRTPAIRSTAVHSGSDAGGPALAGDLAL